MEKYPEEDVQLASQRGQHVSWLRKVINILGCLMAFPIYWIMTVNCRYPVTLDLACTIMLAELNRFVNEGRRIGFYSEQSRPRSKMDSEKLDLERQSASPRLDCVAAVVGWREDPTLFTQALESYKVAKHCSFMLVGIDGDEEEDQDMVRVFNKVYPRQSRTMHIPEPLGTAAEHFMTKMASMKKQYGEEVDEDECHDLAMNHCIQLARRTLEQEKINFRGVDGVRQLCIRQKHMHKKGIMFTTYVFSLVIADMLGLEFLWSSDSDTLVLPDSLERTVNAIAADPKIGGASSGLIVHNESETAVTKLSATVYWGELYLTRSTPAATATSDCQSGPSTVFRLAALPSILVPWYLQTVMGKRMIINEDRHLTTNLLSRGWGVVFASDVLTATETPTTLSRWIMQQVRWGRATHIESLLQPKVYLVSHPLLFYGMAKRESGPVIGAFAVLYYFLTSRQLFVICFFDLAMRMAVSTTYNILRNPQRLTRKSLVWVIPGIFFYYIPLPAIHVWSMMTLTADGWGTTMRAASERSRASSRRKAWWELGFVVVWMGIIAGAMARWVATSHDLSPEHRALSMLLSSLLASFSAWVVLIK
ncbi:glycosyltransferase family 2 protein [Ilyonectria destructans]|nr:glycosyltransferase family 2 protein [Ilyonectria destructans]